MKYTKKVTHTREQLMHSLLENIKEKPFIDITINDIVEPIYLDRSTFYRYFDDKYELLSKIEDIALEDMQNMRPDINEGVEITEDMLEVPATYFRNNSEILSILLSDNGSTTFEIKLKKALNQRFHQLFNSDNKRHPELLMLSDLLITIVIHSLKYWVLNPQEISLEETLLLIREAIENGLFSTIKKYS